MLSRDRQNPVFRSCPGLRSNGWSSLTDSSGGSRLSESSFSDSVSIDQPGSCGEEPSGTHLSDQAVLVSMELQNQDCQENDQDLQSNGGEYSNDADSE